MRERREFQLSKAASQRLDLLAETHHCSFSDVIEGLLLGNLDAPRDRAMMKHGLSPSEALAFVEAGR